MRTFFVVSLFSFVVNNERERRERERERESFVSREKTKEEMKKRCSELWYDQKCEMYARMIRRNFRN